ncbi:MAG: hypothetical protein ABL953_05505 [Ilumatobacteraceae bacterium]
MRVCRLLLATVLVGAALPACSNSRISGGNTSSSAPTTTAPTTTTQPQATTSTSSTVAASTTSTTSTIPAVLGLDLSAEGLGGESFGADAAGVIAYVESILGSPTSDTGWVDTGGMVCFGTETRDVRWGDLSLSFGDESPFAVGLRHFYFYTYGPAAGEFVVPFGLSVEGGISIGDTVDELLAAYPSAVIAFEEEMDAAVFYIVDGLTGFLTGTSGSDTITTFVGGFGCGG